MSVFHTSYSRLSIAAALMLLLTACVPQEQLDITQENIKEGINTRVDATVNALTETVNAVKDNITSNDTNADTNLSTDEENAVPANGDEVVIAAIAPTEEETPPPSLDPKSFLGHSISHLTARLGAEDYRRLDHDILVLQYRMPSCILDFVMSPERVVTSYHSRHRISGQNYDDATCRLDLAARRDQQ